MKVTPRPPNPDKGGRNGGTGSSMTLFRLDVNVARSRSERSLRWIGVYPATISTPRFRILPPLNTRDVNPDDGAGTRWSSRFVVFRL